MHICTGREEKIMRINENNYVDKAEKVIKELAEESKQRNRGRVDIDRKSTRLNSSHPPESRMPSSA